MPSSNPFTANIVLSASATSVSSSHGGSTKRSQSPVGRGDLGRLAEPIAFGTAKGKKDGLPEDIASLQPRLNDLLDSEGILPACLRVCQFLMCSQLTINLLTQVAYTG